MLEREKTLHEKETIIDRATPGRRLLLSDTKLRKSNATAFS